MLPSLGYITELEQAADRGNAAINSKVDVEPKEFREAARAALPDADPSLSIES